MKLIAWDTSSKSGALVAMEGSAQGVRLVTELTLNVDLAHSERLLWGIHQVLESAHWSLPDIDVFGVGVGPGSFTGLRVGLTTARTLADAVGKPLVGVSSLAALARPVAIHFATSEYAEPVYVIASSDACKGELFALWGQAKKVIGCVSPGLWKKGVYEEVVGPHVLIDQLKSKLTNAKWVAVGEGRQRYLEEWAKLPKKKELEYSIPFSSQVQGRYLGQLVWEAFQNQLFQNPLDVHPRYLRASDAELKLKAGLLKNAPV